jgi:hypothetical protein
MLNGADLGKWLAGEDEERPFVGRVANCLDPSGDAPSVKSASPLQSTLLSSTQ